MGILYFHLLNLAVLLRQWEGGKVVRRMRKPQGAPYRGLDEGSLRLVEVVVATLEGHLTGCQGPPPAHWRPLCACAWIPGAEMSLRHQRSEGSGLPRQQVLCWLGRWVYEAGQRDRTICVPGRRSDTLSLACGPVALPKEWEKPSKNEDSCRGGPWPRHSHCFLWNPAHLLDLSEEISGSFQVKMGCLKTKGIQPVSGGEGRSGRNTDPLGTVNHHQQYGSLKNSV